MPLADRSAIPRRRTGRPRGMCGYFTFTVIVELISGPYER